MRLPRDTLLQILVCLRRQDLDLLVIVGRQLEILVSGCASELPLRCVEKAWIHGPIPGQRVSMLNQVYVPAKKIPQSASSLRFIYTFWMSEGR